MPDKPTYEELGKKVHEFKLALLNSEQEADHCRQVIDCTIPVIYAKNLNGQYTLINNAFEELSGFKRVEVIGKTDFDLFPEDVAKNSVDNDRKVIETSSPIEIEEFGPVQGKIHNFISFKYPLISYDHKIDGVFGISTDITQRKSAEKIIREKEKEITARQNKLEKSEALFRGLFNNMTSGSAILKVINQGLKGSDYIIIGCNKASLKIEGKTIDQVIGKSLFDLRPSIDKFGLIPILKKVWETGEPDYFPIKIYQDEKFSNYYENFVFKLPSGEVVTIYNDVTDQKNSELALKHSEKKYQSLSKMLRLMCDNVTDMIWAKDFDGKFIFANKAICRDLLNAADTNEPIGKTDLFFGERERELNPENPNWHTFDKLCQNSDAITLEKGVPQQFDESGIIKGKYLFLDVRKAPFVDETGKTIGVVGSARDMTEAKKIKEKLKKWNEELEDKIIDRTRSLEDLNTALRVLLKKRDDDKKKMEEKIFDNYKSLISPFLQKLKSCLTNRDQQNLMDIVESNLKEFLQPFSKKLSDPMVNLTPTEIQIASMVKQGLSNKEIAQLLNSSIRTITNHRQHIREKLGLKNKKINLRSFLSTL